MENKKRIFNVTELSMYLFCPRQFLLQKVLGIRTPVTKEMIGGRIIHEVLENFSNQEILAVERIETFDKERILNLYLQLLQRVKGESFERNMEQIGKFDISTDELENKINKIIEKEIILRLESLETAIKNGFSGKSLWENLSPKYFSEFSLFSPSLGLKGRVDRVLFSDEIIIPFELKTRDAERVFESDEIQLAAYSLLLEERFQRNVPIGILEAGSHKHEIQINSNLRKKLSDVMEEMNLVFETKKARFPPNFSKCQSCKLKKECGETESL